tara:strand:+ start:2517 stop:3032 length:516 start_codon:yes stop_codon:yes gene_type:complete
MVSPLFFRATSSIRWVGFLAIIATLLFAAMAIYTSPLEPSIPEIQLTFTASAFNAILAEWKPAGVHLFKVHFLIDYPFLVSYGALGYLISIKTRLFTGVAPLVRTLHAISLPVAAVADATENALHLFFLFKAGPVAQSLYFVAGTVVSIKWLLIVTFVGSAIYARYSKAAD